MDQLAALTRYSQLPAKFKIAGSKGLKNVKHNSHSKAAPQVQQMKVLGHPWEQKMEEESISQTNNDEFDEKLLWSKEWFAPEWWKQK